MDYLVKVRSVDAEQMEHEIITHGELSGEENDYILTYSESTEDVVAQTQIRVLDGECVIVRRTYPMETDMVIEVGKKHISEHKLPFGSFNLEVIGSHIKSEFDKNKSKLQFAYATYQDNELVNRIEFDITVKKKRQITANV